MVLNKDGVRQEHIPSPRQNAWQPMGVVVLGTPLGGEQVARVKLQSLFSAEPRLSEAIPHFPVFQSGWQLLLPSANAEPTTLFAQSRQDFRHNMASNMTKAWCTARALLGDVLGSAGAVLNVQKLASLPMSMGSLGLTAAHCAGAPHWASWAQRNSEVADAVVEHIQEDPLTWTAFGRSENGDRAVRQAWFRMETQLVRALFWTPTRRAHRRRTRRVATWLELMVFFLM